MLYAAAVLSLLLDVYVYFGLVSNQAHISHRLVMRYVSPATMVVATEPPAAHNELQRWTMEDCVFSQMIEEIFTLANIDTS